MPLMDLVDSKLVPPGGLSLIKEIDHHVFPKEGGLSKRGINQKHTTSHISRNDLAWEGVYFQEF